MSQIVIEYDVVFDTDYHVGSGVGLAGVIDNGLIRDFGGRLYIPGTTLKGIIRDACEDLMDSLKIYHCHGQAGPNKEMCGVNRYGEPCLLCLIFGTPAIDARFSFKSARRRDSLWELLSAEELRSVSEALSRVETHNRIGRRTGVATEKFLFSYELGRRSEPFKSRIEQIFPFKNIDQEKRAITLLVSGMRFVNRLGGRRRRGKGHCQLKITQMPNGYKWDSLVDTLPSLLDESKDKEA